MCIAAHLNLVYLVSDTKSLSVLLYGITAIHMVKHRIFSKR